MLLLYDQQTFFINLEPLMMVTRSFETSETIYPATLRHTPEGRNSSFLIEFAWIFKNTKFQDAALLSDSATWSW